MVSAGVGSLERRGEGGGHSVGTTVEQVQQVVAIFLELSRCATVGALRGSSFHRCVVFLCLLLHGALLWCHLHAAHRPHRAATREGVSYA